jgi:hypothetical protein
MFFIFLFSLYFYTFNRRQEVSEEKDILAQKVENLHKVVNNLKTVIEEKDEELSEMMSAMTPPVAAGPLSNELAELVTQTKGNSLFGEVEDRRVQVEKKPKKYQAKLDEL